MIIPSDRTDIISLRIIASHDGGFAVLQGHEYSGMVPKTILVADDAETLALRIADWVRDNHPIIEGGAS